MAVPTSLEEYIARSDVLYGQLNQRRGSDTGLLLKEMSDLTEYVRVNLAPAQAPNRVIVVNELADLPTPVAGVITLENNVQYLIGDNFSIGENRLVMSAFTVLKGVDIDSARIEYTGTGVMITAVDVTFLMDNMTVKCNNGQLFDVQDSVGAFTRLINLDVGNAGNLGSFQSSAGAILLAEGLIATSLVDGLDFSGSFNILQISLASNIEFAGTFLDFGTATFNSIGLSEMSIFLASPSATFMAGLPDSGNINAGGLARMNNCVINNLGGGTILDGITVDDTRWRFMGNQGVRDSRPDALGSFHGNATATVISAIDTPVKVNATWEAGDKSQFTVDATGKFTFIGEVPARLPIGVAWTALGTTGGGSQYAMYIAINGEVVTNSGIPVYDVTNTKAKSGTCIWQHTFQEGDYVEFYVENKSGTDNVIVTNAVGRIN